MEADTPLMDLGNPPEEAVVRIYPTRAVFQHHADQRSLFFGKSKAGLSHL